MSPIQLGLGEPPWIVGHRGAAGEAPENTLDSLLLALDQGVDMVECDLQLTADGEFAACHDWTLERMGSVDLTIEETDFADLEQVEVSGPFRRPEVHRVLATLDDVFTLLPDSVPLNLELKRRHSEPERLASTLASALERAGDRSPCLISSFDWELLAVVRRLLPGAALAPLGGRDVDPGELLAAATELAAWSVHCRHTVADDGLIAASHQAGRPVLVYTVNDVAAARSLFARGVAGVFSDFPGRLRRELGEER